MIKTAVIGASGYVGRHLLASYRTEHADCLGTSFSKAAPGLTPFDIREPDIRPLRLVETGHQAVLIASANPNIKYCEDEKSAAYAVNVTGTLELIRQLARTSLPVIFLSSDYVFPGDSGPHDDADATRPSTEYGRHKKVVEDELPRLAGRHIILRLSKIFGLKKGDGTLLDDMAGSLSAGRQVQAAADQFFCPTYVDDLVAAIHAVQARELNGVMNFSSPEIWSRHRIAAELARAMGADAGLVKKISLYDFPSMAGRPLNTSMACSRLQKETDVSFTPLQECIKRTAAHWSRSLSQ
jgi:dTDP-4-dehydrorhamnose reductase